MSESGESGDEVPSEKASEEDEEMSVESAGEGASGDEEQLDDPKDNEAPDPNALPTIPRAFSYKLPTARFQEICTGFAA